MGASATRSNAAHAFDRNVTLTQKYNSARNVTPITVDETKCNYNAGAAPDRYGMVVLTVGDSNHAEVANGKSFYNTRLDNATGEQELGNSQLQQVLPDGTLVKQYVSYCEGSPLNFNQLSHELRLDHTQPGLPAWTTMINMKQARRA